MKNELFCHRGPVLFFDITILSIEAFFKTFTHKEYPNPLSLCQPLLVWEWLKLFYTSRQWNVIYRFKCVCHSQKLVPVYTWFYYAMRSQVDGTKQMWTGSTIFGIFPPSTTSTSGWMRSNSHKRPPALRLLNLCVNILGSAPARRDWNFDS